MAFAALSHLSLIVLAIYGFSFTGWTGAVYQILNHGVVDAALFLLLGALEVRYATSEIGAYGGVAARLPRTATFFVIASLAMIGLPMLGGFVGEFMILSSTFTGVSKGWAIAAALGVILGAAYMLSLVQRIFYGPESAMTASKPANDVHFGELAVLAPLAVLMLVMGLAPSFWTNSIQSGVHPPPLNGTTPMPMSICRSVARGGAAVTPVPDIYRILPEVILTVTGVAIMLLEASMRPGWPRRPLGWVAAIGTTLALWASLWQLSLPVGTGFFGTVETSPFTVFFHVLICGIVLVALLLSLDTLPEDSHHQGEFYALVVFGAVGMCLLTGAVELLLVFIALEISSIATYILAGYRKETGRGPEAAIKYFLLGSFATGFLLYGIALIFGATGTTQVYEIARLAPTAENHSLVLAALGLMLVGILFKVSAAPFHVWTPDVYEGAPSPVVALLSTAPKAAAFALLLRVVYEMFPSLHSLWAPLLWIVAVLSMTLGNLAALRQQNVKRMLAYSSIAHAGYLLAAFAGLGTSGIAAASFYTAAYAAMNVGIFAVVTLVSGYDEKLPLIDDFRGLIYRAPLLGSLLLFFLVSLVGIPFTGGFFGKFYSFSAAVNGGAVALAIIGLLNSGLAAGYYLHLALVSVQREPSAERQGAAAPQVGVAVGAALLLAVVATLVLGIVPGEVLRAAQSGAHTLQAPPVDNTPSGDAVQP